MKVIALVLLVLLIWLQYKIWLQDGGVPEVVKLESEVEVLKQEVESLRERNASLDAEVKDLKKGLDAIEERARSEMGMIRQDEVYYQVIEGREDARAVDLPGDDGHDARRSEQPSSPVSAQQPPPVDAVQKDNLIQR